MPATTARWCADVLASVVYLVLVLVLFTALGTSPAGPRGHAAPLRDRSAVLPTALAGLRRLQDLHERGRLLGAPRNPSRRR